MTRHWHTADDSEGIRWLFLDKADSSANVLSQAVLAELGDLIGEIAANPPTGLVFKSGKASGFIAGADVSEFQALAESGQAETQVRLGQQLLNQLEKLPARPLPPIPRLCAGRRFGACAGL